jgi:hypothetical protein
MNGVCVIVAYRPKPGKEQELLAIVRTRVPSLRKEGLVTDRVPVLMARKGRNIDRSVRMEIARSDRCRAQKPDCARDVGQILRPVRLRAAQDGAREQRDVCRIRAGGIVSKRIFSRRG